LKAPCPVKQMQQHDNPNAYRSRPLITIAIPTWNRASLLKDCVASALAQTYPKIEVLISDNASTDDTLEMLKSFHDSKLRILTNSENIGLIGNWNKCVHEAKGEYIVIVADDDILAPMFLEKCVELLNEEPGLPIIVGSYDVVIAAEHRTLPPVLSKKLHSGIWDGVEILKEGLRGNFTALNLSTVMKTAILRRNGSFDVEHVTTSFTLASGRLFLEGRAGLINERCGSTLFHSHPTARHSVGAGVDSRFKDMFVVMEKLSMSANHMISKEASRREFQRLAKRYVALMAIQELAFYRAEGAGLFDVVRQLWSWRTQLRKCTVFDLATTLRPKLWARLLLPASLTKFLMSFR
jgi:glycosyltransferase involved in cell wall biosynthesis